MGDINMSSVMSEVGSYMKSKDGKNTVSKAGSGKFSKGVGGHGAARRVGEKFVGVLQSTINSCGLSANAVNAVSNWGVTGVHKVDDSHYEIDIDFIGAEFEGDRYRPSLAPHKYDGIDNIAALFNNGAVGSGEDGTMKRVWGAWHGVSPVGSATYIPATNFVQESVDRFISEYGDRYNVVDVEISDEYER